MVADILIKGEVEGAEIAQDFLAEEEGFEPPSELPR
jgi:hypothetical protein